MIQVTAWRMNSSGALVRWGRTAGVTPPVDPGVDTSTIDGALGFGGFILMTTKPSATNTGTGVVRPKPTAVWPQTDFIASSDGQVVKDLIINGCVDTDGHDNVFIENCEVRGTSLTSGAGMVIKTGESHNTRIQFSEIYSAPGYGGAMGIGVGNFVSLRNNMHHLSDAHRVSPVGTTGSASQDTFSAIIEGNYVHDSIMDSPDPAQSRTDNKTHSDTLVQIESGRAIRIRGNYAVGLHSTDGTSSANWVVYNSTTGQYVAVAAGTANAVAYAHTTSTIMMSPNDANTPLVGVQIVSNWLGGGEVTINGAQDLDATSKIADNIFEKNSLTGTAIWQKAAMAAGVLTNNKYTDGTTA